MALFFFFVLFFEVGVMHLDCCCFYSLPPFTDARTHPTLACDHRGINRNSLTFFLIEWRVEVILGFNENLFPFTEHLQHARKQRRRGRLARFFFPTLSSVSASTKLCREAVRSGRTAGVARDAQTDVRVRLYLARFPPTDARIRALIKYIC